MAIQGKIFLLMFNIKKIFIDIRRIFLEEFSSVKLAITLFIFLAITTLVGTILPEEPMVGTGELVGKYGEKNYRILKSLGFTDVFHSWWYLALLFTLWINITIASFWRVFPKWKIAFAWPVKLKEDKIRKLPINCELNINSKDPLEYIEVKLKEKKYRSRITSGLLVAVKGGWHRLGASVTHVGIMILLVGSSISTLTGFNGMAQLAEEEGFYVADLGQDTNQVRSSEPGKWLAPISKMPIWFGRIPSYLVKVNKTWRVDYEGGQPKQWYSDLSILDEEKNELVRKTISVNDPLQFMGLDIYQSNWGRFAEIRFNNELVTIPLENFRSEEVAFLPLSEDVGLKLKVVQSKSDLSFMAPDLNILVQHASHQPSTTKDMLELYAISKSEEVQKYLGKVMVNETLKLGPINIAYFGTQTLTGLQFKSNPGGLLMYPGLVFIIFGVFIAFGSRKQIWARVGAQNNKIIIGGTSDRACAKFFEEFEEIVSGIISNN